MPLITVNAGGPDIADGVYPVVLADITGPRTVTAQRGPRAGQDIDLFDWIFHIDAPGQPHDQLEISASTSTASGPRSKMYAFLTALFGGTPPPVGSSFEKEQLVGRYALATVQKDDSGWARITNLGALPPGYPATATGAGQPAAAVPQPQTSGWVAPPAGAPAPAPTAPEPAAAGGLRQQVAQGSSDLPF